MQQWARTTQHDDGVAALAEKVVTLATALNTHDRRTRGHSERSRAMAELIALEMGLPEPEVNEVRWGAFLHDIGKILVPATLLNKPGAPTPHEWKTLRRHPADGGDLVEPLRLFLGSGVEAVSGHHENFDGSGYPHGLAGDDIALSARIVHVADSFEVMTAVRSYKRPMSATEARQELARHSGSQFDPTVVRALLNISLGRLHWSLGFAAWMAEIPFLTVIPRAAAQVGAAAAAPSMSMTALSGVAAISFGSIVAPATLAPVATASASARSGQTVAPVYAPAQAQAAGGADGGTDGVRPPVAVRPPRPRCRCPRARTSLPLRPLLPPRPPAPPRRPTRPTSPPRLPSPRSHRQPRKRPPRSSPPPSPRPSPWWPRPPLPSRRRRRPRWWPPAPRPSRSRRPTPPLEADAPTPIATTTTTTTPASKAAKKLKASKS